MGTGRTTRTKKRGWTNSAFCVENDTNYIIHFPLRKNSLKPHNLEAASTLSIGCYQLWMIKGLRLLLEV